MERIDKILSHEGFGSRKDIKKLLRSSEVLVNGERIFDAGFQIDTEKAEITIDGEKISLQGEFYLMMNKITGTISSKKTGEHQTVFDLLPEKFKTPYLQEKLHLIGRLDADTEGLLIFTTDGALTHRLISPKSHIGKTYFVCLENPVSESEKSLIKQKFKAGIHIDREDNESEADCLPAELVWCTREDNELYCTNSSQNPAQIVESALLTICEGKYHQVKRMFKAAGNKVVYLKRISMGNLELDKNLTLGSVIEISRDSIEKN